MTVSVWTFGALTFGALTCYAWAMWRLWRRQKRAQAMRRQLMSERQAEEQEPRMIGPGSRVMTSFHAGAWSVLHVEWVDGIEWLHLERKHEVTGRVETVTVPAATCEPMGPVPPGGARNATVEEVREEAWAAMGAGPAAPPIGAGDVVRARGGKGPQMNVALVDEGVAHCWWFEQLLRGGWTVKVLETAAACLERVTPGEKDGRQAGG